MGVLPRNLNIPLAASYYPGCSIIVIITPTGGGLAFEGVENGEGQGYAMMLRTASARFIVGADAAAPHRWWWVGV